MTTRKPINYLRSYRLRWGLSQGELAHLLGWNRSEVISRIEQKQRRPTLNLVIACFVLFGTPAAEMSEQVPPEVKRRRHAELAKLDKELRERYFSSLRGRSLRVLVESPLCDKPGRMLGTACRAATVELAGDIAQRGQFTWVNGGNFVDGRIIATSTSRGRPSDEP